MGILDNIENAWDDIPQGKFENLSTKLFSDLVCSNCYPTYDNIQEAIKNKKAIFFKKVLKPDQIPGWQELIDELNRSSKTPSKPGREYIPKKAGRVDIYGDFKYISVLPDSHNDKISKMGEFALILNPTEVFAYSTIFALTEDDSNTGPHYDQWHVFNFQCIGTSKWFAHYEGIGSDEFIAEPGDLVFIPDGVLHEVHTVTPRVCIGVATKNKDRDQ
jgi:hypothetical protein